MVTWMPTGMQDQLAIADFSDRVLQLPDRLFLQWKAHHDLSLLYMATSICIESILLSSALRLQCLNFAFGRLLAQQDAMLVISIS